ALEPADELPHYVDHGVYERERPVVTWLGRLLIGICPLERLVLVQYKERMLNEVPHSSLRRPALGVKDESTEDISSCLRFIELKDDSGVRLASPRGLAGGDGGRGNEPGDILGGRLQSKDWPKDNLAQQEMQTPQIWNEVNQGILFPLTSQSSSTWERLGGIAAIEATLETKRNLYRLLRYLKNVLPTPEMPVMNAAASTFGKILQVGGPSFTETVLDAEVLRAVDLMTVDKTEHGRYAGIIILIETATHASGQFYRHVNQILEKVVTPMRDPRETVRKVAATLLSRCLSLVANHDKVPNPQIFVYILAEAQKGITNSSSDVIQGSLLIYRELLMSTNMFMEEHFADTCEKILSLRQHKDMAVRKTVTNLLPVCARYDPTQFNEQFLYKTMGWLLPQLAKPAEKQFVLEAIGPIALSVTSEMRQFMPAIMVQIKESLAQRNMLAAAVGPNLTKLLHDQLDLIFAYEFNEYVRSSLAACAKSIPPLLRSIQDRLLDKLSLILSGESHRPSGAPLPGLRPEIPVAQVPSSNQYTARNPESIQLALDTLATFDFSGHQLNDLVRTCALPYLEDAQSDIRLKAAITCCRLFMQESFMLHHRNAVSLDVINEVLEKLLMVSIADTVLSNLHERFDKYLSQPEHIRLLFMALNDEVYDVRYKAIEIIGRVGYYNPAHVMPALRKTLIQLLTELEYTSSSQGKSTSAEFLTSLIRATNRLIKPYTLTLLRVVLPKASDTEIVVSRCMIECIGLLAVVGGDEMVPHVPEVMNILLAALQDPLTPTTKRDAALLTMGQLCANTGYVVDPLVEHPVLFTIFARLLKTDTSMETRREVLRLLGILGAVDPYMRRKRMAQDDPLKDKSALQMKAPMTMAGMSPEEYFQTVVMSALLNIVHDGALTTQYLGVVEIIPAFINVTRISNARHQDFYLQQLASLTDIITNHVRPFVKDILEMCRDLWNNRVLHLQIITLIDSLARVLDTSFKPHLPSVLPMLLSVSKETSPDKRQATEIRVFNALLTFSSNVEEYVHIVLPFILSAVERPDASPLLRKTALKTIAGLAKRVNISDHASRIVHPLVRLLPGSPQDVREAIRETMCALVFQLSADFAVFVPLVKKNMDKLIYPVNLAETLKFVVNQQHLKQAWDVSKVESREDWQEWFKKFSTELLRESMSPALRACVPLVDTHPPLGLDLFNAAFISCWTELYDQYQDDLVASITRAL
ncbi:7808_t:CDS:10, partial [Acaulospora colombiana]